MKYDVKAFELLSNEEIADGIFDMRVKNDELFINKIDQKILCQ